MKFTCSKLTFPVYQTDPTPFKISSRTYLEIVKDDFSNLVRNDQTRTIIQRLIRRFYQIVVICIFPRNERIFSQKTVEGF